MHYIKNNIINPGTPNYGIPQTLNDMETNIINITGNNDNNSIVDAISKVLNELVAMDLISDHNITGSYKNDNIDESKDYSYTILLPSPYGRHTQDDDLDAKNREIHDNLWHELLTMLGTQLDQVITYKEHQIIYSETEYLMLHFDDETIHIIYHYTGQW